VEGLKYRHIANFERVIELGIFYERSLPISALIL